MSKETETTKRIVTLGILSALGAVLMLIQIPYPFVPFLKLDLSDVVVLVVFSMYGWKESLAVGVLKALVNLLVMGPAGYYAIGQVVAIMASMSYVLGMYLTISKFKLNRYLGAGITVVLMTLIMVVANYLFVTPIYVGELTFLDVRDMLTPEAYGFNIQGGYLLAILIVYVPFNLIKGILITGVYISISEVLKKAIN